MTGQIKYFKVLIGVLERIFFDTIFIFRVVTVRNASYITIIIIAPVKITVLRLYVVDINMDIMYTIYSKSYMWKFDLKSVLK